MKSIAVSNVRDVLAARVKPGMILAEGIVLSVDHEPRNMVMFETVNAVITASSRQTVQIYGYADMDIVEAVLEAKAESRVRRRAS